MTFPPVRMYTIIGFFLKTSNERGEKEMTRRAMSSKVFEDAGLTSQEEMALRMRHGVTIPDEELLTDKEGRPLGDQHMLQEARIVKAMNSKSKNKR